MRYFGYRPEQSPGVEDTNATIRYLNMGSCTLEPPKGANLDVPSFEETPNRTKRGLYSPSGDLEIALDVYSISEFLYYTLGAETVVTANKKFLIYSSASKKLPTFTAYVGKDDGNVNDYEYICYGCVISKLKISLSDGLATATLSLQAQKDGKAALKSESAISIPDSYPIAFYEAETFMGNTELTARTTSFELEFDNGVKAENGQAFGNMHPYKLNSNGKTPTIKSDIFYEGYDMLVKFWGNTEGPVCNTEYESYKIVFTDEEDNVLTLLFPKIALDGIDAPVSGTDEIKQTLELTVLKGTATKPTGFGSGTLYTSMIAAVELN